MAICAPGFDLITYVDLQKKIISVARCAKAAGLSPGQVVALFPSQANLFNLVVMLGLARLGVITVSLGGGELPKSLRFDAIVSDGPHPYRDIKTIPFNMSWVSGNGEPVEIDHISRDDDVCRIVLTSGSTGEPKPVALTHRMVLGRAQRYQMLCGNRLPSCSRLFCGLPLATSFAYTMCILTLCKGGTVYLQGKNAKQTFDGLSFYGIDSLIIAPGGLPGLLTDYEEEQCHHTFDAILTSGSLLSGRLAERLSSRMASNVISSYGATETSLVASAPGNAIREIEGAAGYVVPGMTVEIVDELDRPMPSGEMGTVRIRGEYMANGYVNDVKATAQIFRDGWFYPGDMGSLTTDGMLIIAGRQANVLNVGGLKFAAEKIEDAIAAFDAGVLAAAVVVTTDGGVDQLWVAIESAKPIDEGKLRQHCQKLLAPFMLPKRFVGVDRLPRTQAGKLDRGQLRRVLKPN
jgi:acyl-coenzyme A synthetase/AMP-(fatty) acid ligase